MKLYNCDADRATIVSSGAYQNISIHLQHLGKLPELLDY
jgi:hypothetical protein